MLQGANKIKFSLNKVGIDIQHILGVGQEEIMAWLKFEQYFNERIQRHGTMADLEKRQ